MDAEGIIVEQLQALQKQLGKKQSFEEAVSKISSILRVCYSPSASPALRKAIYSAVCRVATILQTRYTTPGFWSAGLKLFEEAAGRVTESSERGHLKNCIARAREHLHETENPPEIHEAANNTRRYLFEGHLTVEPEPPPPAWLVAQNLLTTLANSEDWNAASNFSRQDDPHDNSAERNRVPEFVQELINSVQEFSGMQDLDDVIEASLQEIGAGPQRPPPASKEVVANLPIIGVTPEVLQTLGSETECAVCQENLVLDDKMQQLPCNHLFHPDCLKPWLDQNNSCPICRHELRTDDHAYESWKEREMEAEEERRGAANALRGGEYMYV